MLWVSPIVRDTLKLFGVFMIQVLALLFAIYIVFVIYLEYLVLKNYKKLCDKQQSGIRMFLMGYRKKINCLMELNGNHPEVEKILAIDRIIKKVSVLILFLVVVLIIAKKV